MRLDPVAAAAGDLVDSARDAAVLHLGNASAARADHVMVMRAGARYVRVLARRKVEPLHETELGEELERPKQRRATYADAPVPGDLLEIRRGEVAVVRGNEVGDRSSWPRQPIPGVGERVDDRIGSSHAQMIPRLSRKPKPRS